MYFLECSLIYTFHTQLNFPISVDTNDVSALLKYKHAACLLENETFAVIFNPSCQI